MAPGAMKITIANDNESQIKFIEMDANGRFWEMH